MEKMMKYLPFVMLAILTIALATFTIVGQVGDTSLYSSPLMIIGWFIVAVSASYLIFRKRKSVGISTILIHASFIIILLGAFFSHFSKTGMVHLREGETKMYAVTADSKALQLPFPITLQKFEIEYYHASDAPKDFVSYVETNGRVNRISMNKILDIDGYRLFQTSYDEDGKGSVITVTHDPIGTTITYVGYILLAISMILFLFGKRSHFRQILTNPLWKTFVLIAISFLPSMADASPRTFPVGPENSDVDEMFGKVHILYNGRIAPMETYALDFTRKLTGKDSYGDFSATQVLAGWIFAPEDWRKEKMIKSDYGMLDFDSAIDTLRKGMLNKIMTKEFDALDEKIGLILDLQSGAPLKIFPDNLEYDSIGQPQGIAPTVIWLTPETAHNGGMKGFVQYVNGKWPSNSFEPKYKGEKKYDALWEVWYLLKVSQETLLCSSKEDYTKLKVVDFIEHIYNKYGKTAPLAYASLFLGLISFFCLLRPCGKVKNNEILNDHKGSQTGDHKGSPLRWFVVPNVIIFIAISAIMAMRGVISGRFPMSNGYETMLFISWIAFAATVLAGFKLPLVLPAGFFIGGFALLVSKLGMMNPEITPLVPVLASPWMSIHVTLMMLSYTIFAFMAFNSIGYLLLHYFLGVNNVEHITRLALLNRFLLYPATFMLAIGIFIGAVWANESWGSYWSWDPKETWALITMIIYAMAFHKDSISWMRRDTAFQIYILVSFASIIMTYFGVNYLLGGMHSYAG